ncbi:MAG: formylglycine-generating enzyme family protein, partial [Planctomycetes bacterium]|nr:formylglycine-generating enzyme family protein [Planctomycetota bacterium]
MMRSTPVCALLAIVAILASTTAAQPPTRAVTARELPAYARLVAAAKRAVERREIQRGLKLLRLAVAKDDARYEAYAVATYALLLRGDDALARTALADAMRRAPAADRKKLAVLAEQLAAASSAAAFQRHLDAGYLALERNLPAKAARELEAAFEIKPDHCQLALDAAVALVAIEAWSRARGVLRAAAPHAKQPAHREQVRKMLAYLEPIVDAAYRRRVAEAEKQLASDPRAARATVRAATTLAPERPEAYRLLARLELASNRHGPAVTALRAAVERGWLDRNALLADPALRVLTSHTGFRTLIADTFGADGLAQLARPVDAGDKKTTPDRLTDSTGLRLCLIPSGRFTMGSPHTEPGRDPTAERSHPVTISRSFYLGATEVTQRQWKAVMGNNPSVRIGDDLPVHRVSWSDAAEFCRRMTRKENAVYRLPTEAEWEYACRAGSRSSYAFGPDPAGLVRVAWFKESAEEPSLQPVARLTANRWGLHDMHGNV